MSHHLYIWVIVAFTVEVITTLTNNTEPWNGKWFPLNPLNKHTEQDDLNELFNVKPTETKVNPNESWKGKWFPDIRNEEKPTETIVDPNESWKGKWFPHIPSEEAITSSNRRVHSECDDGKNNIDIDFDPENKRHSFNYLCLAHKNKYEPSYATSPIQKEYIIPPAYKAPSYCLNETIEYEELIPTFGAHRHLYPKYGEYKFLPIQRWMHNLEYGAIVMLYHPCAYHMQIEKLRSTLDACLYRHVITPSTLLRPKRPLALVAWGKSLEMSVVDVPTVVNFIKENAKKGPQTTQQIIQAYDAGLLVEAKLVTDESDSEICANINL